MERAYCQRYRPKLRKCIIVFVGYIHLTVRGTIYVSVPLVHGKAKLDSTLTHLRSYCDQLKGTHVHVYSD